MIANITKGKRAQGGLIYDFGPGRKEEHLDPRFVAGNVPGTRQQVGRIIDHHTRQADAARPIWRCSLSLPDEDGVLPDATWGQIAQRFITEMGFEDCPWVAVRHGDDHIHLTVSRVSWDGTIASDQWDYRRARKVADGLEADYGLTAARTRFKEDGPGPRSGDELAAAKRRGQDRPEREQLRELVRTARQLAASGGRELFEDTLALGGVGYRANIASTGRMNGYSFSLPGWTNGEGEPIWLKASEIGKDLAWSRLSPVLGDGEQAQRRYQEVKERAQAVTDQLKHRRDLAQRTLDAYRGERPTNAEGDYELAAPAIPPWWERRFGRLDDPDLARRLNQGVRDVRYKAHRHAEYVERSAQMDAVLNGTGHWSPFQELADRRAGLEQAVAHLDAAAEHARAAEDAMQRYRAASQVATDSDKQAGKRALWLRGTTKKQQTGYAQAARNEAAAQNRTWDEQRRAKTHEEEAARRAAPGEHNPRRALAELTANWTSLAAQAQAVGRDQVAAMRPVQAQDETAAALALQAARDNVAELQAEQQLRTVMPQEWAKREAIDRVQAREGNRPGSRSTARAARATSANQPQRVAGQKKPKAPKPPKPGQTPPGGRQNPPPEQGRGGRGLGR